MFLVLAAKASGQLVHYRSNRFNSESLLPGEAVAVAGGSGITSTYVNPANISDSKYNQFSLNARMVKWVYKKYALVSG